MAKFESLLRREGDPEKVQLQASRELPSFLAQSRLNHWTSNSGIPSQGIRFLIGVACWSLYEMRLLDALDYVLAKEATLVQIDVFDIDECLSQEDIDKRLPGIGRVYHTPVVGVWQDGEQVYCGSGYAGRAMVANHFEIDHPRLVRLPGDI